MIERIAGVMDGKARATERRAEATERRADVTDRNQSAGKNSHNRG